MSDDSRPSTEGEGAERPRPQFGEYATAEEQRARIQRPEVTEALEAGVAPQPAPAPEAPAAFSVPATRGGRVDRIVTFGLLFYGLFSVVTTIVQLLNFPEYAERGAQMLGVTATFTNLSAGYVWGAAAAFVYGIGWLLTAVFTWRRLKSGRLAFWIPLVGFVATALVAGVCITMALVGDQQFMTAIIDSVPN
ncbi:hypothetical protein B0I12_002114 [Microbacterium hydrothermale]|uniref:DUF6264 family protein n=1 Tax=Microbacterium hydrothermale TaxID=857427 RepID=UPI002226C14A|nr:DUF6264 family protein [Microbacterium hydrothermale]MCW2164979.1 hypothetical protein [Microbacterium hydrothermale]